jgi:hypothetical protein
MILFITTAVKTSNPTEFGPCYAVLSYEMLTPLLQKILSKTALKILIKFLSFMDTTSKIRVHRRHLHENNCTRFLDQNATAYVDYAAVGFTRLKDFIVVRYSITKNDCRATIDLVTKIM